MILGREEELLLVRVNRELRSFIALLEKVSRRHLATGTGTRHWKPRALILFHLKRVWIR